MKAMITGASSGIGKQMAIYLDELGYDLILVAKDKEKLMAVEEKLSKRAKIIVIDLSDENKIKDLYVIVKNDDIDMLINNAGFGMFGNYNDIDVLEEQKMINVNVKAVAFLTRLFLKDFAKKDSGYILNVASAAGLLKGGPLMSAYYATKSFVTSYTFALYEELRRTKSNVHISCLCPGPVDTNFNNIANVRFTVGSKKPDYVARYAIDQMLNKNKLIIIPGKMQKIGLFFSRFLSAKLLLKITYKFQKKKKK